MLLRKKLWCLIIINHLDSYHSTQYIMIKLFDKIVEKSNGKITYHLITYFIMIILISLIFLVVFV
jgi:hypothetical protein